MASMQRLSRPFTLVGLILALTLLVVLLLAPGAPTPGALAAPAAAPAGQIGFSGWSPMGTMANQGAETTSAPAAVSWGSGRLDVFVRGRNGELYQNYRERTWSGWRVPDAFRGVVLRSAPSCAAWGTNRLSCVALVEGDEGVVHFYWDGAGWARESLGGRATSAPSIVSPGPNQLAVFVAGEGSVLFGMSWVRNQWSAWFNLGGVLLSAPSCAVWPGDPAIQCFVISTQPWLMRQEIRIGQGSVRGGPYIRIPLRAQTDNELSIGSAPSAVAVGPRRIGLMLMNFGQALYTTTWSGRDEVIWQRTADPFSPMLNTVPSCAVVAARLECFARGPDSALLKGFGDVLMANAALP